MKSNKTRIEIRIFVFLLVFYLLFLLMPNGVVAYPLPFYNFELYNPNLFLLNNYFNNLNYFYKTITLNSL